MNEDSSSPRTRFQTFYRYLYFLKEQLLFYTLPNGRKSLHQLRELRDSQRGKRCFILGNGPSLRQTNLNLLREEITFGLNRIYLLFPEMGFPTTYLVAVNRLVLEQCAEELLSLPMVKFVPWSSRKYIHIQAENRIFLNTTCRRPGFAQDVRRPIWTGATVTFAALQLAYHMGFETVILIGVDHSFATKGKPHTTIVSEGDDPNHFSPNYFGKGFRWQLPDLETSEIAYRMARQAFEQAGRQVLDATIGGKLTVFEKVDYYSLF